MEKNIDIDMTSYGDALELSQGGHLDTSDVLGAIFEALVDSGKFNAPAKTKVLVLGSRIEYPLSGGFPYRVSVPVVRSLGCLKRKWKGEFDVEKYRESKRTWLDVVDRHAEGRAAWGWYSDLVDREKKQTEENEFQKSIKDLPIERQEQLRVERQKNVSGSVLYIG